MDNSDFWNNSFLVDDSTFHLPAEGLFSNRSPMDVHVRSQGLMNSSHLNLEHHQLLLEDARLSHNEEWNSSAASQHDLEEYGIAGIPYYSTTYRAPYPSSPNAEVLGI